MPILFAVSPLAAMRSAPTTTASTFPAAMSAAAALSAIRVAGRPSCTSSYAVSLAPGHRCKSSVKEARTHEATLHLLQKRAVVTQTDGSDARRVTSLAQQGASGQIQ